MKRILAIACLALATFVQGIGAQAKDQPILRAHISTVNDIVTVGDFYQNAGALADEPLFRAPDLGTSGAVPADLVSKRAKQVGLENAGTDGLESVTVHRRADTYDVERLKELVAESLANEDALVDPQDLEITFFRTPRDVQINPASVEPVVVNNIAWSSRNNRFNISYSIDVGGRYEKLTLSGHAMETVEVLALTRAVGKGSVVQERDFTRIRLPKKSVPTNAANDAKTLIGLAARQNMKAGMPLLQSNFERPILISRGEKVTLTFLMPGMKLTTRGQAMIEGAMGDIIDVMNLQSRRTVPAEIIGRGQVRVLSNAPVVASLGGTIQ
ncbi:MAG: flagellar basal body P-ring formation protein FlgA [Rhodobacteraceae bacterium]|nr:flagellar basal body P-ring formation protein FlgA [Paracoccaceae bacterium]